MAGNKRILFFVRRIGPYHHARFLEASKRLDLAVVQTRASSQEYSWQGTQYSGYPIDSFDTGTDSEKGLTGPALDRSVTSIIDKHLPAAIVTTGWADPEYHAIALVALKRKIPLTVLSDSRYEDMPRRWPLEILKRMILKSYSSAIVAGSASRSYLQRLGFNPAGIFSPWDVVDNNYFSSRRDSTGYDSRYFLCVSRLIEKKNLPLLISAYAGYRSKGGKRKLEIAGDGPLEASLKQQVADSGLQDYVSFRGFVQYDALPSLLSRSLCLILASSTDQWGLVVNEAMASGVPVLVSGMCGCAADLVEHGKNGLIFDPFNVDSIISAMNSIDALDQKEWVKMAEFGSTIVSKYSTADFTQALSAATDFAISNPPRQAFQVIHKLLRR